MLISKNVQGTHADKRKKSKVNKMTLKMKRKK